MAPRRRTLTLAITVAVLLCLALGCCDAREDTRVFTRARWGAQPLEVPNNTTMREPVDYVVIHHTADPAVCESTLDCMAAMRSLQRTHIVDNKFDDIGYTFCIGGDGRQYEGRGWGVVGADAFPLNDNSVGICLFGDYRQFPPRESMLNATKELIVEGVRSGHIAQNYTLLGHSDCDVGATDCPGRALYEEIKKWDHFGTAPSAPSASTDIPPSTKRPLPYKLVSRNGWFAAPPNKTEKMVGPIPVVVIHHTTNFTSCNGLVDCTRTVNQIQKAHLDRKWDDIAYSFCVGGHNRSLVLEGRGWDVKPQFSYNSTERNVDICIIGNHTTEGPTEAVKSATQALIAYGVQEGYIAPNYKLVGHKNLDSTAKQCPGDALQRSIETWPHFDKDATATDPPRPRPPRPPQPDQPGQSEPSAAAVGSVWQWHTATAAILVFHSIFLGKY